MKFTLSIIVMLCLAIRMCSAQVSNRKHIDLKAVQRIELVEDRPGVVEYKIERDKANKWVSERIYSDDDVTASGKIPNNKFIREIPESYLKTFLKSFSHPVLTKNIDLFNINQDTLISYLDSIGTPISVERKSGIVKDIRNPFHLQKAFEMLLIPRKYDHRTLYQIKLIMVQGDTIVAKALSFADPYIPWEIEGVKTYDPKLTSLYDYLCGNERYEVSRRGHFYKMLTFQMLRLHRLVLYPQKRL
jgi:hypothetical protein